MRLSRIGTTVLRYRLDELIDRSGRRRRAVARVAAHDLAAVPDALVADAGRSASAAPQARARNARSGVHQVRPDPVDAPRPAAHRLRRGTRANCRTACRRSRALKRERRSRRASATARRGLCVVRRATARIRVRRAGARGATAQRRRRRRQGHAARYRVGDPRRPALLHTIARLLERVSSDARRSAPRHHRRDYESTILNELNLHLRGREHREVATQLRRFARLLYVPRVYWDHTREDVLVLERIHGMPIANIDGTQSAAAPT